MNKIIYYCPECGSEDIEFNNPSTCFQDKIERISLDKLAKPKRKLVSDYITVSLAMREATCSACGYSVEYKEE